MSAAIREALEPFAKALEEASIGTPDTVSLWFHPSAMGLTVGDLRRARTAYDAIGSGVKAPAITAAMVSAFYEATEVTRQGSIRNIKEGLAAAISCLSTHTAAGAGPAADEEVLPCDVMVAPRTLFRKGVRLSTMLAGLRLRASWPEVERIEPTAVPAGAEPVGEAVAWRVRRFGNVAWFLTFAPDNYSAKTHEKEPLYARPAEEAGEVERLTRERDEVVSRYAGAVKDASEQRALAERRRVTICEYMNDERLRAAEAALAETRERLEKVRADIYEIIDDERPCVLVDRIRAALTGDAQEGGK